MHCSNDLDAASSEKPHLLVRSCTRSVAGGGRVIVFVDLLDNERSKDYCCTAAVVRLPCGGAFKFTAVRILSPTCLCAANIR